MGRRQTRWMLGRDRADVGEATKEYSAEYVVWGKCVWEEAERIQKEMARMILKCSPKMTNEPWATIWIPGMRGGRWPLVPQQGPCGEERARGTNIGTWQGANEARVENGRTYLTCHSLRPGRLDVRDSKESTFSPTGNGEVVARYSHGGWWQNKKI